MGLGAISIFELLLLLVVYYILTFNLSTMCIPAYAEIGSLIATVSDLEPPFEKSVKVPNSEMVPLERNPFTWWCIDFTFVFSGLFMSSFFYKE